MGLGAHDDDQIGRGDDVVGELSDLVGADVDPELGKGFDGLAPALAWAPVGLGVIRSPAL